MGAKVSKYLEQDTPKSDDGVLLENHATKLNRPGSSRQCTRSDSTNNARIFAFCQLWDLNRVEDFVRCYMNLVMSRRTPRERSSDTAFIVLPKSSDIHRQYNQLTQEVAALEECLAKQHAEIERVTIDGNETEISIIEERGETLNRVRADSSGSFTIQKELRLQRSRLESELKDKAIALQALKLDLFGSFEGVELCEIVSWPLYIEAMLHVTFHESMRSSRHNCRKWHPACTGLAMERKHPVASSLDEYDRSEPLLQFADTSKSGVKDEKRKVGGGVQERITDCLEEKEDTKVTTKIAKLKANEDEDGAVSENNSKSDSCHGESVHPVASISSDDRVFESGKTFVKHINQSPSPIPRSRYADSSATLNQAQYFKRSTLDSYDAHVQSPIFFGYLCKQKNRVVEALESEKKAKVKADAIFQIKITAQKDKFEAALGSEREKLQALIQKMSDLRIKRDKLHLERARNGQNLDNVFIRVHKTQDKEIRAQEEAEDEKLNRLKLSIEARMKAAELEHARYLDQVAIVRCYDRPLGDTRMQFHKEELELIERGVTAGKKALATAQEEYAALKMSNLCTPGQETKLRSQSISAERCIKVREIELERVCHLIENERYLFERAQDVFEKEELFAPLFKALEAGDPMSDLDQEGRSGFQLVDLVIAILLGAGKCPLADKIVFLFDLFAQSKVPSSSKAFPRCITFNSLAEVVRLVISVLLRIKHGHNSRPFARESRQELLDEEAVELSSGTKTDATNESFGLTLHEFQTFCTEAIERSTYLCGVYGQEWKHQPRRRFVAQYMSPIQQYKVGLIDINDLKDLLARQTNLSREEEKLRQEMAVAQEKREALKAKYAKYLLQRHGKLLSNAVPLDHGGYCNLMNYHREIMLRSVVKVQATWRAKKGRQEARLTAEKQAFYHARGLALMETRERIKEEWRVQDTNPFHTVDKVKFETKLRMKQVSLRAKGSTLDREDLVALMTEEAVVEAQNEVENRFREMEEDLGYRRHREATQRSNTETEYLRPDIAKALVDQLLEAKRGSPSVHNMIQTIAMNEKMTRQKAEGKESKLNGTKSMSLKSLDEIACEKRRRSVIDRNATFVNDFRSDARSKIEQYDGCPPDLDVSRLTKAEMALKLPFAFPELPLKSVRYHLQQVCEGLTDFKLAEFLQELPSKRHICAYAAEFRRCDGSYDIETLETDLYAHFRILRGFKQLACALVNIVESDLDFGLTRQLVTMIQEEKEQLLRQWVTAENRKVAIENARLSALKSHLREDESDSDTIITTDTLAERKSNHWHRDSYTFKRKQALQERRKRALEAHHRMVEATKAWKEAELSLQEMETSLLRVDSSNPVLPIHRTQWSERFRNACRLDEADANQSYVKYTEIVQVCQDFLETATLIALTLIREWHLPFREKSILFHEETAIDGRNDDIRSRSRVKYEVHGILFQICTDDHGRYENSHEYAAKAGGHEVRNSAIYLQELSRYSNISVPLQCTVDFQGFRVLCSSKSPIEVIESEDFHRVSKKLVHGTDNCGRTVTNTSKDLDDALASVATRLNLSQHCVKGYDDRTSKSLHAAADMRGYLNAQNQFVLLNFKRAMPPEDPNATPHLLHSTRGMTILWRQLRPELVHTFQSPLSPDALSCFTSCTSDWQLQALGVESATKYLMRTILPQFAVQLAQERDYYDSPDFDLVKEMHRHGINMRHLGLLRAQYFFQLSGTATLQDASAEVQTSQDFTRELDRGAILYIGGQKYSVSKDNTHRFDATCITLTTRYAGSLMRNVPVYTGRPDCQERSAILRRILLGEMVARTFKNIVRHLMRQAAEMNATGLTPTLHNHIFILSLNWLSGSRVGSDTFWQLHLFEGIRVRFGLRAVSHVDKLNFRMHLLPVFAYIIRRVSAMMAFPLSLRCLECVAKVPDCYTFVLDDLTSSGHYYRVKHNVSMLDFSKASLLLHQATEKQASTYEHVIVAEKPTGYWPLCDRQGTLEPSNFGSCTDFRGKYLPGCILEGECSIKNVDRNQSLVLVKASRTCVRFCDNKNFYQDSVNAPVSLQTWCRCDGYESTRRVVMTLGRFCISALKTNLWSFSMIVKGMEISVHGSQVVIGKWTFLVGTYDGTTLRFYVNGLFQNEVIVESFVDLEARKHEAITAKTHGDIIDLEDQAKRDCSKEVELEMKLFFTTKEGRRLVKTFSCNLFNEHESRKTLFLKQHTLHAFQKERIGSSRTVKDASDISFKDFESAARKQLIREKFDEKWSAATSKFLEMKQQVERGLEEQSDAENREFRIGCLSINRRRDGKYFFHGNIAHVAFYNGQSLTRDQINAHYVMGTCDRAHECNHLFALAFSRFARALEYAPNSKQLVEKLAKTICASFKDDFDPVSCKKKLRFGLRPFITTKNAHGIAEVINNLSQKPIFSELFLFCYQSLLEIQPNYLQSVDANQCRLPLQKLGRMPFAFFMRSANSVATSMSWYNYNDNEDEIVATFADIIDKVLVHYPTFYGDHSTSMMWLRKIRNPKAKCHFILAVESKEDVCIINFQDVLDISDEEMEIITQNNTVCTNFQLARCSQLSDATLRYIALCCSQLKTLDISYCTLISDKGLAVIGKNCNHLVSLKLMHCIQIQDEGVEAIVRTNPRLETIGLSFCTKLSDRCFGTIGKFCPELSTLELEFCVQLSSNALKFLAATLVNPRKLQRLNVGACRRIGDEGVVEISKVCTELKAINLRLCDRVTNLSIQYLLQYCLELEMLNLEELNALSCKIFVFDQTRDGHGIASHKMLQKIKALNFSACTGINDLSLGHLAHQAKKIESLNVSGCKEVSDQGLTWLFNDMLDHSVGNTQLLHLNVSYCPNVTARGIHTVAINCPNLVSLSLSGCVQLGDGDVIDMLNSCSNITKLELAFCRELTDTVLHAISRQLSLEELNLSRCIRITDDGMLDIAKQSCLLRRLNVSACKRLSERTLDALLEGCRLLEEMDVTHCPSFSTEWLAKFAKRKVKVICRKPDEVLIKDVVKEMQECEEFEKEQQNETNFNALSYPMKIKRRAKNIRALDAAKTNLKVVVSDVQMPSSYTLPRIERKPEQDDCSVHAHDGLRLLL